MRVAKRILDVVRGLLCGLHGHRRNVLVDLMTSVLSAGRLTLTDLGRHLPGRAFPKHRIKRADRALSNPLLAQDSRQLCRQMAHLLLAGVRRPVLLVDWTKEGPRAFRLSASIAQEGRSILLYEEVHPEENQNNALVEEAFLRHLQAHILPAGCRPVLVTDMGFRLPWFRAVQALEWDFVGRVQPNIMVQAEHATCELWMAVSVWNELPRDQAVDRGWHRVGKTQPMRGRLVTYHGTVLRHPSQKRQNPTTRDTTEAKYRRKASKAWVLVTSLGPDLAHADSIVGLYRLRMQCEEAFREDKSERYGLGLNQARSEAVERRTVLRTVAQLAHLTCHLAGLVVEQLGRHTRYQANTIKERRVLSLPRLGREALRQEDHRIFSAARVQRAISHVRQMAQAKLIPA